MDAVAVDHAQLERERLLDTQQCECVVEEILALRAHWTARDESVPFFTLGAASYLDARQSESAYRRQAVELNPLLRERFGWLLERVRDKVSEQTGLLAEWAPAAAVPGFHIFLACWVFTLAPSAIHFDTQHRLLDWTGIPDPDFSDILSYTLPVQLPRTGGGLNVWNIDQRNFPDTRSKEFFDAARGLRPTYRAYRVGELVMHSGNLLHQMAATARMHDDDRRITLQGHGIRAGGRIYLYW